MAYIKQIKDSSNVVHDIDAKKWDGHLFSEITDLVHGVVDTYVIPATKSSTTGYAAVVGASTTQVSTTISILKGLVSNPPSNDFDKFGVGDVVLMGATSDGTKNFDRWISNISGTGDSAVVTLDVLETEVQEHHHTFGVSKSKAITGVNITTNTTANVATVGTAVTNVLTGESGDYVTSVNYSTNASDKVTLDDNLAIEEGTSTEGVGHKHTITAHSHSVKFKPSSMVSQTVSAYTSLTSADYTPHSHSIVSVAGAFESDSASAITYVYDKKSTNTFVKSVKDATSTTATGNATPGTNEVALTTSTQVSTDAVGDIVKTTSAGEHTHSVTTTTTENVVKTVSLQVSVVTSVSHNITAPTVAANVVTSVTTTDKTFVTSANLTGTTTFVNNVTVDDSGILSFGAASVGISNSTDSIKGVSTITSTTQSAGSTSISYARAKQTYTSGTVGASGTAAKAGAHQHGFSHTHAIAKHKHTVDSHTHTYYKTIVSETDAAITALSTKTYTPHKHTNISAAGVQTNDSTPITYVTGGSTTNVVQNMKNTDQSCTVGNNTTGIETDTKYYKLTGDVKFPGLTMGTKTISTKSIIPAVDSGEKAIKSITFTSSSFVTDIVEGDGIKTSVNIGGTPS